MSSEDLIHERIDQATHAAQLELSTMSHTIRVWQLAPIRTQWTALLPVRAGHEAAVRAVVHAARTRVIGPDGGPPRNAIGLLELTSSPDASLRLAFMPAGSDMVYAHYDLAYHILAQAAPHLHDARWYALLSQCEDMLDRWWIADGTLQFERLITEEGRGREVLVQLEPSLADQV